MDQLSNVFNKTVYIPNQEWQMTSTACNRHVRSSRYTLWEKQTSAWEYATRTNPLKYPLTSYMRKRHVHDQTLMKLPTRIVSSPISVCFHTVTRQQSAALKSADSNLTAPKPLPLSHKMDVTASWAREEAPVLKSARPHKT